MDEILDDELVGRSNQVGISFIRWWEKKRLFYNIIVGVIPFIIFLMEVEGIKVLLIYFAIVNILYSIFSLLYFLFRFIFKEKEHPNFYYFFQNKGLWIALFYFQIFIAFSFQFLIIIGGGSAQPAPMNPTLF